MARNTRNVGSSRGDGRMKTIHQLQLRDSPFNESLHGRLPETWEELFSLMEALDFVVREWAEGMISFGLAEQAEEAAAEILMENMKTRYAIYSFLEDEDSPEKLDFLVVMKQLSELKQSYVYLAKSYAKNPQLSHWYLNLPLKVASAFKSIRQNQRNEEVMS